MKSMKERLSVIATQLEVEMNLLSLSVPHDKFNIVIMGDKTSNSAARLL